MAVNGDAPDHEVIEAVSSEDDDQTSVADGEVNDDVSGDETEAEPGSDSEIDGDPDLPSVEAGGRAPLKAALGAGMAAFIALSGVAGWIGFGVYEDHRADQQRREFVEVARQGAVNLTTIDYQNADADIQRILDSATGAFYDDFNSRAQPFIDVVRQAKSKSVGTVVDAGLESQTDREAQVLVAVNVKTSMADSPQQDPRSWRMRISVQKLEGDEIRVSNVSFVP